MSLVEFLEFLLRRLFVLGNVGMVLARERAKGLLDFFVGRLGRHSEDPVVVFEFNGHGGCVWNASGH